MKQNFIVFYITAGILILVAVIYYVYKPDYTYSDHLQVIKTWELTFALREVSGISHIDDSRIACIQDEDGIIFIYDLEQEQIVNEIEFGPRGDYESIRIIDSTAYVMQSNGSLYKISNFESKNRNITTFKTEFSSFNDMESFDYNPGISEFLTVPKENNLSENRQDFIIYRLDPETFKLKKDVFTSISYEDPIFKIKERWFMEDGFLASELSVHPLTNEIYMLDSRIPKLLILHPDGKPKALHMLNPEDFQQPEGLSFDQHGRMYISNEESDFQKQNIHLVELK